MFSAVKVNKLVGLYLFSVITLFIVVYIVPVIAGYSAKTWAEFYRMLGQLIGIWGLVFGAGVLVYGIKSILDFLIKADLKFYVIRCSRIELVLLGIFIMNMMSMVIGISRGESWTYILGDTLKGSFIPLFYLWAKNALKSLENVVAFTKLVLFTETVMFIMFSVTDLIPFAQSTRTFLYTISFTLFFEEEKPVSRLVLALLTLFALFIVMATGAFRGTVLIFLMIIGLNYLLRFKARMTPLFMVGFMFVAVLMSIAISLLDLNLEQNVSNVSKRFESTLQNRNKKNFGLEESVFQRVGETIDVVRSFSEENPVYTFIGFGNGALLNNVLITPSEYSVYHTNEKHNIYITLLGIFFRQGLIGFVLYVMLFIYLLGSIKSFYVNRKYLDTDRKEYVYLKVLILYHFSVVLYSFVAYLFVGNIVIAFTIPLHIMLRQRMENDARLKKTLAGR